MVFKTAPELCNLLKAVEEEYRRGKEGGVHQRSRLEGPYADVLPWIQSQAVIFETGAKANCRDAHILPNVGGVINPRSQLAVRLGAEASCRHAHTLPTVGLHSVWCPPLALHLRSSVQ